MLLALRGDSMTPRDASLGIVASACLEAAMRVYVQRPDGAIVDLRVPGPYNTDALDDMAARAKAILAEIAIVPAHADAPTP